MFLKLEEILRNFVVYLFIFVSVPILSILIILTLCHTIARFWCEVLLFILGVKIQVISKTQLSDKKDTSSW